MAKIIIKVKKHDVCLNVSDDTALKVMNELLPLNSVNKGHKWVEDLTTEPRTKVKDNDSKYKNTHKVFFECPHCHRITIRRLDKNQKQTHCHFCRKKVKINLINLRKARPICPNCHNVNLFLADKSMTKYRCKKCETIHEMSLDRDNEFIDNTQKKKQHRNKM